MGYRGCLFPGRLAEAGISPACDPGLAPVGWSDLASFGSA